MKKVYVINIDNYDYLLSDGKNEYKRNIEFYSKKRPMKGDIIYLSDKVLSDNTMLSFIEPYNDSNLSVDDIIKVVSNGEEYYLQREYG